MRHHNYTRMTRWDTVDSTTTTQRGDDSTRMTRWSWLDEVDLTRRWLDEARCVDEDYSMSHGKGYLNLVVRVVDNWKGHLFCEIFFSSILNVKSLLKLWSFIQFLFGCFILLINPLFWNTKVSYHFHLHNYYMYKLVSLLTFYSSGIDSTNGIGGLISALTRWISL